MIPGYEVVRFIPSGPVTERYVLRDDCGVSYEIELLAESAETYQSAHMAYRSLRFVAGLSHPCLPESQGTVPVSVPAEGRTRSSREVPLWEHLAGALSVNQLIESVGNLHPVQAVEIVCQIAHALSAVEKASRNSTGDAFPHLALTPANIVLRENRTPAVLGWGNRAAYLADPRPSVPYPRFLPFLDTCRPKASHVDRRHDVYALTCCLFYLLRGHGLPYALRPPDRQKAALQAFQADLGRQLGQFLARCLDPLPASRPSVEAFAGALTACRGELEAVDPTPWKMCGGCGLLMRHNPDLCPLCIRDSIVPIEYVPPPVLHTDRPPLPMITQDGFHAAGLEEIGELLPPLVEEASERNSRRRLEETLRRILLSMVEAGLRPFIGDLINEDGTLSGASAWVAGELAHRIDPPLADRVSLSRERGAFLRFLAARERAPWYRKTLQRNVRLGGLMPDVAFRGRLYIFTVTTDRSLWTKLLRARRRTHQPVVLIVLRGEVPRVPAALSRAVTVYWGVPPRRVARHRGVNWLDEYGLFCFLRGPAAYTVSERSGRQGTENSKERLG